MKILSKNFYAYRDFLKDLALPCSLLVLVVLVLGALGDAAATDGQAEILGKCFSAGSGILAEKVVSTIFAYGVAL